MTHKINFEVASERATIKEHMLLPPNDGQWKHPEHLQQHEMLQVLQREALNGNIEVVRKMVAQLPEDKEEFDAASKGMDWAIVAWDIDQYIRNRLKYQTEKLDTLSAKKELEFLREALNEMLIDKGLQYPE